MKKAVALLLLSLLFCGVGHATLYRWSGSWDSLGNTPESGLASGSFDVGNSGELRLATLSFDNIAWSGFQTQFVTQTPIVGNTRMYVADCLMHSDSGEGGEYSFWNKVDNPEDGTWWLGFGNNSASGRILSFAPDTAPTPEPSTFALCSTTLLFYFLWRRICLN